MTEETDGPAINAEENQGEDRTNETKKRIIKMAIRLFKEKGSEDVTINEICEISGVSKHTFYYYFKKKDDILDSFFRIPREIRAERLQSIISAENFFEQYWLLVEPIILFFEQNGADITRQFFFIRSKSDPKSLHRPDKAPNDDLELHLLEKAQAAGEIRNQSYPKELLHLGFHMLMSESVMWGMTQGREGLNQRCRWALETAFDLRKDLRKAKAVCHRPPNC